MLKIGLTGGIGCGKTSVSNHFLQLGVPIIDADTIAHELVQPGQHVFGKIVQTFGTHIKSPDGSLDRRILGDIVFSNPDKKRQLEAIVHPHVFSKMQVQLDILTAPYAILSIPLLLESGWEQFVNRILVVDCSKEQQIERVAKRNKFSRQHIQAIIESQASREQRIRAADDIINNSGCVSALAEQIKKLHNLYLSLSTKQEN